MIAGERTKNLRDIQGHLIGFNKDHMHLTYLQFADALSGRDFLAAAVPQLSSGKEVLKFNALYKEIRDRGGDLGIVQATWVNLWLSHAGLAFVEAPELEAFPVEFTTDMSGRASVIGDEIGSSPANWIAPFAAGASVHAVFVFGADDPADLDSRHQELAALATQHNVVVVGEQAGDTLASMSGHEHFGFKDGISQPSIKGFTKSSKGGDEVPAGEFLIGYEDAFGQVSGQPVPSPPPLSSAYAPNPPVPQQTPLPKWAHNGSFVVYRRLQQDVAAFRQAMTDQGAAIGLTPDQLGAKIVGRWPSGAPLEHVPGEKGTLDTTSTDPSVDHPSVLDNRHINKFDYSDDPDGLKVPHAAHIRKCNPRADVLPDGDRSGLHRMLRRGIPYGPEFTAKEPAYGQTVDPSQDRGLLFISYQASIARAFEFVQANWINAPSFLKDGDGQDPITSQTGETRSMLIPPDKHPSFAPWVLTTGGGYFFSPSLSGLEAIGSASATS